MNSLRLRQSDYHFVIDCVENGSSCSIIGLSNTGKSMLLRDLAACTEDLSPTFVYVDCNLMLAATDQGFYEAVLRALQEVLAGKNGIAPDLLASLNTLYHKTVQPESPFLVPLSFNDAIMESCEALPGGIVLLLDEFDEAYAALDSRVFLNLRALHDKYRDRLAYVTATVRSLKRIRTDPTIEEFYELLTHNERYLDMLTEPVEIRSFEVVAPATMQIEVDQSRPYWAYFASNDVEFPLSVVVRMDGKRLIFRFEGPAIAGAD